MKWERVREILFHRTYPVLTCLESPVLSQNIPRQQPLFST